MKYDLPFRTVLIKNIHEYKYPFTLPFELDYDRRFHFVMQKENKEVDAIMELAYKDGVDPTVNIGEGEFGKDIASGFFDFIHNFVEKETVRCVLDVGCGTGYCVYALKKMGIDCIGIEPGRSLCDIAKKRYGVDVLCGYIGDFSFDKKFDMVYAHGVLDHVRSPELLIEQMAHVLKKDGLILFSVPNQRMPLEVGDPSMMVHQHRSYFTPESVMKLLKYLGFVDIGYKESQHYAFYLYFWGRYVGNIIDYSKIKEEKDGSVENLIKNYELKVNNFLKYLQEKIDRAVNRNETIGLYGAITYTLGLLNWHGHFSRVFDTDEAKHGFYLPCNPNPIENPENLVKKPVDQLWIQAYKYDNQIRSFLEELGVKTEILSYKKLFDEAFSV